MVELLQTHHNSIVSLCQRYHVKQLSVFGSAARETDFTSKSDVDFLVEFKELEPIAHKNAYFGLWFELEDLLKRPTDLVVAGSVQNPYILKTIEKDGASLYRLKSNENS